MQVFALKMDVSYWEYDGKIYNLKLFEIYIKTLFVQREVSFAPHHFPFLRFCHSVRVTHLSQHRDRCVMGHMWAKYAHGIPPGIPWRWVWFMWWQRSQNGTQSPSLHFSFYPYPFPLIHDPWRSRLELQCFTARRKALYCEQPKSYLNLLGVNHGQPVWHQV